MSGDSEIVGDFKNRLQFASFPIRSRVPNCHDDESRGFTKGSRWFCAPKVIEREWVCTDETLGAAVWRTLNDLMEAKKTSSATASSTKKETATTHAYSTNLPNIALDDANPLSDAYVTNDFITHIHRHCRPTRDEDVDKGWTKGSVWFCAPNVPSVGNVCLELWVCVDNSPGAAVWRNYEELFSPAVSATATAMSATPTIDTITATDKPDVSKEKKIFKVDMFSGHSNRRRVLYFETEELANAWHKKISDAEVLLLSNKPPTTNTTIEECSLHSSTNIVLL